MLQNKAVYFRIVPFLCIVCTGILFFPLYTQSQNLIPNPGFEQPEACPSRHSMLNYASPWYSPSKATPDWFCACNNTVDMNVWVPENFAGAQDACEGRCYAGVFAYVDNDMNYGEYLAVELLKPLKKGENYVFSFYYSPSDLSSVQVEEIGVWISKKKFEKEKTSNRFSETPALRNSQKLKTDSTRWHLFSETYTARGGERFVMIGFPSVLNKKLIAQSRQSTFRNEERYLLQPLYSAYFYLDHFYFGLLDPQRDSSCGLTDSIPGEAIQNDPPESSKHFRTGESMAFQNLLFESDRSEILSASFPELDALAEYLNKNKNLIIRIEGHTDSDGDADYNRELSQQRAKSVAFYLESKGIHPSRIQYKGFGAEKPLFPNDSKSNKARNRRVEFTLEKN